MSVARQVENARKLGFAKYWHDMQSIGDAKVGNLVGVDMYVLIVSHTSNGNKYYENVHELPGRTRWVDFKNFDFDTTQLDPIWHAWLTLMRTPAPAGDLAVQRFERSWQTVGQAH